MISEMVFVHKTYAFAHIYFVLNSEKKKMKGKRVLNADDKAIIIFATINGFVSVTFTFQHHCKHHSYTNEVHRLE